MQDAIIYIDPGQKIGLQNQIRQKLVDGIINGAFPAGMKLPSSRKLANQLEVSRNTVVAAYHQLIADGYLVSRHRSGIFVSEKVLESRVAAGEYGDPRRPAKSGALLQGETALQPRVIDAHDLPNWSRYPYPFIDGRFDASLFPLAEWREANRLAMSVADVARWSADRGGADDPMLLDEIRTKILTRRGIQADADEILVTLGTQNSFFMISQLLGKEDLKVVIEEPGNTALRKLFTECGANVLPQPVDDEGIIVDDALADADIVCVSPSHQIPTAVVMSLQRRKALMSAAKQHDFVIIEDDYECETSYMDHPLPALRSMDTDGRVIYVASFSNVLGPGIRLGFVVGNSKFISRARKLREKHLQHPPHYNQRAAAYFLSLGHYDALMLRLGRILRERRRQLRSALNNVRGIPLEISPEVGGTTYWVRAPEDFDVDALAMEAERHGILIEPVNAYYANRDGAENCFRMGVTSLTEDKIRPGVERLVEVIRDQVKGQVEHLRSSAGKWLTEEELAQTMAGATLLYREVNGWPCTIVYHPDGSMSGHRGFANEDHDSGRWRVDGQRFYRKWDRWVYGEEKGYFIVIDADKIKFFNDDEQIVDSAFIRLAEPAARGLDP